MDDKTGCLSRVDISLFLATLNLTHDVLLWSFPVPFLVTRLRLGQIVGVGKNIGFGCAVVGV